MVLRFESVTSVKVVEKRVSEEVVKGSGRMADQIEMLRRASKSFQT
jgi:hypothetical protein